MDDLLVDGVSGGAEVGELAVRAVALHDVDGGDRLPADLIGRRPLDDRPVHAARLRLLLDVVKTTIDDRIERVELALGRTRRPVTAASRAPAAPVVATILARPALPTVPAPGAAFAPRL